MRRGEQGEETGDERKKSEQKLLHFHSEYGDRTQARLVRLDLGRRWQRDVQCHWLFSAPQNQKTRDKKSRSRQTNPGFALCAIQSMLNDVHHNQIFLSATQAGPSVSRYVLGTITSDTVHTILEFLFVEDLAIPCCCCRCCMTWLC